MYQKSRQFTNYTDYSKWQKFPFRETSRRYFPTFFKKQTGLDLAPNWKDPPIHSITKSYIDKMVEFGFKPDQDTEDLYLLTGISLPLLIDRRQLGGFLTVYKPRENRSFLKWVKYTHPKLVGPETPLMTFSGPLRSKPDGLIVDDLNDYFKLINWIYCQEQPYSHQGRRCSPPLIIYIDQGEEQAIEQMRRMQLFFNDLTDFTGKFVTPIKEFMYKSYKSLRVDTFHYFDSNPLIGCESRIQFEDLLAGLRSSFHHKTPLVRSE